MRDTIFSALYGSMVMFDNHDNAHAYQVRCKRAGQMSLPILVEEDGASLVGYTSVGPHDMIVVSSLLLF